MSLSAGHLPLDVLWALQNHHGPTPTPHLSPPETDPPSQSVPKCSSFSLFLPSQVGVHPLLPTHCHHKAIIFHHSTGKLQWLLTCFPPFLVPPTHIPHPWNTLQCFSIALKIKAKLLARAYRPCKVWHLPSSQPHHFHPVCGWLHSYLTNDSCSFPDFGTPCFIWLKQLPSSYFTTWQTPSQPSSLGLTWLILGASLGCGSSSGLPQHQYFSLL